MPDSFCCLSHWLSSTCPANNCPRFCGDSIVGLDSGLAWRTPHKSSSLIEVLHLYSSLNDIQYHFCSIRSHFLQLYQRQLFSPRESRPTTNYCLFSISSIKIDYLPLGLHCWTINYVKFQLNQPESSSHKLTRRFYQFTIYLRKLWWACIIRLHLPGMVWVVGLQRRLQRSSSRCVVEQFGYKWWSWPVPWRSFASSSIISLVGIHHYVTISFRQEQIQIETSFIYVVQRYALASRQSFQLSRSCCLVLFKQRKDICQGGHKMLVNATKAEKTSFC